MNVMKQLSSSEDLKLSARLKQKPAMLLLLLFFLGANTISAQQKTISIQDWETKLVDINEKILTIEERIEAINDRISGVNPYNAKRYTFLRQIDVIY